MGIEAGCGNTKASGTNIGMGMGMSGARGLQGQGCWGSKPGTRKFRVGRSLLDRQGNSCK